MTDDSRLEPVPDLIYISDNPRATTWFKSWLYNLWYKVIGTRSYQTTLTPALVAANTSAEQTFTVPGLTVDDIVIVNKPSVDSGIVIGNVRVSAADTLAITFGNLTAGGITPTSEQYEITAIKKDLL